MDFFFSDPAIIPLFIQDIWLSILFALSLAFAGFKMRQNILVTFGLVAFFWSVIFYSAFDNWKEDNGVCPLCSDRIAIIETKVEQVQDQCQQAVLHFSEHPLLLSSFIKANQCLDDALERQKIAEARRIETDKINQGVNKLKEHFEP